MGYRNKEDQAASSKRHYDLNKDAIKLRAATHKQEAILRNKAYVSDFLKHNHCVDCGESDQIVLEFDHVTGEKVNDISTAMANAWSLNRLKLEIAKCEVRCCNCHRRMTYYRRIKSSKINSE